jgi:hypothetical protein
MYTNAEIKRTGRRAFENPFHKEGHFSDSLHWLEQERVKVQRAIERGRARLHTVPAPHAPHHRSTSVHARAYNVRLSAEVYHVCVCVCVYVCVCVCVCVLVWGAATYPIHFGEGGLASLRLQES